MWQQTICLSTPILYSLIVFSLSFSSIPGALLEKMRDGEIGGEGRREGEERKGEERRERERRKMERGNYIFCTL
jgi:hypothetical protein